MKPEIRFEGFDDDWEQRKLGEITSYEASSYSANQFKNKEPNGDYPLFDANNLVTLTNEYDQEEKYISIIKDGAGVGRVQLRPAKSSVIGTMGYIKKQGSDLDFIFYIMQQLNIVAYVTGSTIPHIYYKDYSNENFFVPSLREQKQISRFLKTIDNLITLHQRKLERLTKYKDTMLEKMFPKEGEIVPELRFSGFTDPWEQRKFEDVFVKLQSNSLSWAQLNYEQGIANNVHYGDILIKFGEYLDVGKEELPYINNDTLVNKYRASFLENGDIIFADAAEDETVGKCTEIQGLTTQIVISGLHTIPCRPIQSFAKGYLGYYLNSKTYHNQLLPLIQGTKVSSISRSSLNETYVIYPKNIEEQTKIGLFFNNLDNLITLHQHKLEKFKNMKKALLDKMFV